MIALAAPQPPRLCEVTCLRGAGVLYICMYVVRTKRHTYKVQLPVRVTSNGGDTSITEPGSVAYLRGTPDRRYPVKTNRDRLGQDRHESESNTGPFMKDRPHERMFVWSVFIHNKLFLCVRLLSLNETGLLKRKMPNCVKSHFPPVLPSAQCRTGAEDPEIMRAWSPASRVPACGGTWCQ